MPVLESIAIWAVVTLAGSWLGHEGRENYTTGVPSKWSNASNLIQHLRGTLATSPPPLHSFPPPLRTSIFKLSSSRDFASTLSYEQWARLLTQGDERLGLKNPERAATFARILWIKLNEDGSEIFSYPGELPPNEARKYVCAIHTGLLWAEEDLSSLTRRRRVDSVGSSSTSTSSSASLDQLVTPRSSVFNLAGREEVEVVRLDSDREEEEEGDGERGGSRQQQEGRCD